MDLLRILPPQIQYSLDLDIGRLHSQPWELQPRGLALPLPVVTSLDVSCQLWAQDGLPFLVVLGCSLGKKLWASTSLAFRSASLNSFSGKRPFEKTEHFYKAMEVEGGSMSFRTFSLEDFFSAAYS